MPNSNPITKAQLDKLLQAINTLSRSHANRVNRLISAQTLALEKIEQSLTDTRNSHLLQAIKGISRSYENATTRLIKAQGPALQGINQGLTESAENLDALNATLSPVSVQSHPAALQGDAANAAAKHTARARLMNVKHKP